MALSILRRIAIGFAPAATLYVNDDLCKQVAVVVPSPTVSLVLVATLDQLSTHVLYWSLSSISRAPETPSQMAGTVLQSTLTCVQEQVSICQGVILSKLWQ